MKPQRGFVALLMIVLIAVGVFGATAAWVASDPPRFKQSINQEVLAQAKEALLAYVAVSDGTTASMLNSKARLPCPDRIGDGVAGIGNCGATGETVVGLLPWSTLGLPPLRDADGECLWYAVSGDFKNATSATNVVNADSTGMIKVVDEAGRDLATELVAVVFAPGGKLASQVRTNSATLGADKPCATPSSATPGSGAPADVAGYLDPDNVQNPLPAAGTSVTFKQLTGTVDKQSLLNDQLAWITTEDYAAAATLRNAEGLKQAFSSAVQNSAAYGRLPFASDMPGGTCVQNLYSGFLPVSCSFTFIDNGTQVTRMFALVASDDWPQLAFYAVSPGCNSPGCAPALQLPGGHTAKAVLLMRGRQPSPNCPAIMAATEFDKWLPCIEGSNHTALSNPTGLQTRVFVIPDKRPVSNDVLKELQ
jgi:hypothetical protein